MINDSDLPLSHSRSIMQNGRNILSITKQEGEKRVLELLFDQLGQEKLSLITSNPCFEIWLYYGKCQPPLQDFIIPSDPLKMSQALKRYLNEKVKGGINPKWAICDVETATRNAKKAYSEDNNGLPTLFSTNMFVLTEELLPLIQRGLDTLKKQRAHVASHHD